MTYEKSFTLQNLCSGFSIIWGLYAIYPFTDMFVQIPQLYQPMLDIVNSEVFWGALFGGGGLMALYYSLTGRRPFASFLLGCIFISFSVLYFMGDPISPGGALYGWVGLFNLLYWVRRR